ncbi:MAG: hypothetical protein QOH99_1676 [Frankiaceae bacterium]|nr:hypothetical protein [Frankiaceae bacterium]
MTRADTANVQRVISWRSGVVTTVRRRWGSAVEVGVDVDGESLPALAYVADVGEPTIGDRVLLNVSALAMGLGTGGHAFVVALPDRLPLDSPGPGHVVKARYTPGQVTVLSVDEETSPHRSAVAEADDLAGLPVVTADLHSALIPLLAAMRADAPGIRVAYVMTDSAALPLAYSRTVAALASAGWLAGTVTCGQSYGGDLEASTLHMGLLAARHVLDADAVVVCQGPGNLGTGARWGFSGVSVGEAVNAISVLGGRAVGALRISGADTRERHQGVSHHSLTAYGRVALRPADVVVPELAGDFGTRVHSQAEALSPPHRLVAVVADDLLPALDAAPLAATTMGRTVADDPAYFLANLAAGRHVAGMVSAS